MRKALVIFDKGTNHDILIESALYLKECFNYKILPLYIKNIRREEVIPTTMNGIIINLGNNSYVKERDILEEEEVSELKKELLKRGIKESLVEEFGFPWEIIKEYLKLSDILVFEKGEVLSEGAITTLKNQFKPMILLGEKPLSKLDNVVIANDDGVKINKSVSNFIRIFDTIKKFTMIRIALDDNENKLLKFMKERDKQVFLKDSENKEEFLEEIKNYDLLVMGNLSRSYLFEKIVNKKGLNILEKTQISIFIG